MKPTMELIKELIAGRAELDRIFIHAQPTTTAEADEVRALFDRTVVLTCKIDELIDAEIKASLADMQRWTAELAPITAELRSFAANIDGVVAALGLIDKLLKVVVAIVALII